jgi:hypothetical protein
MYLETTMARTMTDEQADQLLGALLTVDHTLKEINRALFRLSAQLGAVDELDIWTPTAREYQIEDD